MRFLSQVVPLAFAVLASAATTPSRTRTKRTNSPFVTTNNGQFEVNGSELKFIGTNAYWLPSLNSDEDIEKVLSNISATGIKVVRTWAFNDVTEIPNEGTWFQLVANGTTTINNGTNGLCRLDKVIEIAEKKGIYVIPSLTNNWNPLESDNLTLPATDLSARSFTRRDVTPGRANNSLPRNYLSNDYGGMDVYVREFGLSKEHDEFYTNQTIIDSFLNYTTQIVSRYVNSPSVFGWEIANDARCNSSVPASKTCTAQTVTQWHATVAQHIKSVDPNHLVASGNQGFFCVGCPKINPVPSAPSPQPSNSASNSGSKKAKRNAGVLTKARVLKDRNEAMKKSRQERIASGEVPKDGIHIRGRWASTATKRQSADLGPAFDGSQGVDSEDILGIPDISFATFQLFPDQDVYGCEDPSLSPFENKLKDGLGWIQYQAQAAQTYGKPSALTGFGLVTQNNQPFFVPFNQSTSSYEVINSTASSNSTLTRRQSSTGQSPFATDDERDSAYAQWIQSGISNGLSGLVQYQWGQGGLTELSGTAISDLTGILPNIDGQGTDSNSDSQGISPNDGYSSSGIGQDGVTNVLQDGVSGISS